MEQSPVLLLCESGWLHLSTPAASAILPMPSPFIAGSDKRSEIGDRGLQDWATSKAFVSGLAGKEMLPATSPAAHLGCGAGDNASMSEGSCLWLLPATVDLTDGEPLVAVRRQQPTDAASEQVLKATECSCSC